VEQVVAIPLELLYPPSNSVMLRSTQTLGRIATTGFKSQALSSSLRAATTSTRAFSSKPTSTSTSIPATRQNYSTSAPGAEFDPNAPTAMDKQLPPAPGDDFNVVIVGA